MKKTQEKEEDLVDVAETFGYKRVGFIVGTFSRVCYKAKTNL
jgi:hypothetical protein